MINSIPLCALMLYQKWINDHKEHIDLSLSNIKSNERIQVICKVLVEAEAEMWKFECETIKCQVKLFTYPKAPEK